MPSRSLRAQEPDAPQDGKLGARIGGKCTYVEHPGTCTIVSIEKTQDSIAQASLDGGPGYEGLTVMFTLRVPPRAMTGSCAKRSRANTSCA